MRIPVRLPVSIPLLLALAGLVTPAAARKPERLKLATTTSTENSGLLQTLLPIFEEQCGCKVDVIPVGTGQALELGRNGDVDLVMVHAPELEEAFVREEHGIDRRTFMDNDFVIVGPAADPAGVRGSSDAAAALVQIRDRGATFISRGDESGTHYRERALWAGAGVSPAWAGYLDAGQGMGAVLTMAIHKDAYTLADRGTFLAYRDKLGLEVLVEGDPALLNPYSVIAVNPAQHEWVKLELATQLMDWLCSEDGQARIGSFRVAGTALFRPTYEGGG